jgi:hypothetical protein
MSDIDTDADLERQVAATLVAHARGLAVDDRPFEPIRTSLDLGGGDLAGPPPSSLGRRRALRAVAATVVLAAGVAGVVARTDDDGADLRLEAVPGLPEDALVPAWDGPDGWELSGLDWNVLPGSLSDPTWQAETVQLIGDPTDENGLERALLVEINAGGIAEAPERTMVRGKAGQWGPDQRNPDVTMLLWDEEVGLHMRATYRGMSTPEVVAILDSLTVRPGGVEAGFDLPSGGLPDGLALLGEARDADPREGPTAVSATFGPRVLEEPGILGGIRHKASVETVSPVGGLTPEYVTAWFMAGRGDDDVARWWTPPEDFGEGVPENEGVLRTIGPDGRGVAVTIDDDAVADDGLGSPEDVARDITDSVAPATSDRLSELWERLVDQWAARELLVSVPTPAGTVELRGTGSESVLCLRDSEMLSCAAAEHPNPNSPPDGGDFDGQWMATVPTEEGDLLVAVSDMGPILMQVTTYDEDGQVFTYPDADAGEADGSWAAVLPIAVGGADYADILAIADVDREAEACLNMLGSDQNPGGAQPTEVDRIRDEGGGPSAMYQACRELTSGSWYQDVGP